MGRAAIRQWVMAIALAVQAIAATPAVAATTYRISLPAQPILEALIAVGVQARVSIGGAERCRGQSSAVIGNLSIETALEHILAGSGCGFRRIDDQTFRVIRAPPP